MIGLLGLNYKTAPVAIREKFSFTKEEIITFSKQILLDTDYQGIVILSTCNRTEIYFNVEKCCKTKAFTHILSSIAQFKHIEISSTEYFYQKTGTEAALHLFEVTSGIDSIIIGEDQIIGQAKDAYQLSNDAGLTDAILMRLFQKSFEAGKRVRTETGIKMGATSVSYASVEVCYSIFNDLSTKNVLLVGAGETGGLALQSVAKKGVKNVHVANRTFAKADVLARKFNGQAIEFDQFENRISQSDIVMIATGSQQPIITAKMVKEARATQQNPATQLFIDLSVPRNVEPEVAEIEGVQLFGVDDLQNLIQQNTDKRREYINAAQHIIQEVLNDFNEWMASRALKPTITTIASNLKQINLDELAGFKKPESEEAQRAIHEYAEHLTQKYTRMLIKNLREVTKNGKDTEYLNVLTELFSMK